MVDWTTASHVSCYFSRYWRHVTTPMFIITSQWNKHDFDRVTCNVSLEDPDYEVYQNGEKKDSTLKIVTNSLHWTWFFSGWKQGILSLVEAMSLDQPDNGWFLPFCNDETFFFASTSLEQRQKVNVPLFVSGEDKNVLQVIHKNVITCWVYLAIGIF